MPQMIVPMVCNANPTNTMTIISLHMILERMSGLICKFMTIATLLQLRSRARSDQRYALSCILLPELGNHQSTYRTMPAQY
jgi:hypothetical protein